MALTSKRPKAPFKIGELARRTGKTVRALQFYEEKGILQPVARTDGGFRLYNKESASRVGLIEKLQALHLTVPEIKALLGRFENGITGPQAAREFREELRTRRRALDEEILRLSALRNEITDTIEDLAFCAHSCGKETGPGLCTSCGHASDEATRPEIMTGVYG